MLFEAQRHHVVGLQQRVVHGNSVLHRRVVDVGILAMGPTTSLNDAGPRNNGRYATALVIPCILMLKWSSPSMEPPASKEASRFLVGIGGLVPLMLFIAMFGQQLWSDDAGVWMAEEFGDDDNCFVMVAPETLAMHHLYVLKTHVDLTGESEVEGFWRTSGQVESFLETHPECSSLLVVAPEDYLRDPNQYEAVAQEQAPFSLSGGETDDAWRVFRAIA